MDNLTDQPTCQDGIVVDTIDNIESNNTADVSQVPEPEGDLQPFTEVKEPIYPSTYDRYRTRSFRRISDEEWIQLRTH